MPLISAIPAGEAQSGTTQPGVSQTQPNSGFVPTPTTPGGGTVFLQRNLVRLSEESLTPPVGGVTASRFTKTIVAPLPIIYYQENPLTEEVVQVLAMRLGPRSSAFEADTIAETTIVTYNPLGGAPVVELGDDFIIPGTADQLISSLRFRQAKGVGVSPIPSQSLV